MVCDLGFLGNRYERLSLAWDGLCGRGKYPAFEVLARREVPRVDLEPWRGANPEGHVLFIGQVEDDWAVKVALHGQPYRGFMGEAIRQLRAAGERVTFRPHPASLFYAPPNVPRPGPLRKDLEGVKYAVTLNSTAAIDAIVIGVPCVVLDHGSMAYSMSANDSKGLKARDLSEPSGRRQWADRLASLCWSKTELADGSAWKIMKGALTHG
jgi:hypothetical protein